MLDKIFNKKKKDQDIFCVPERKTTVDIKNISKLGPKALQQIIEQQEKYISTLTSRIQEISTQFHKLKQKSDELQQKNQVINAQISKMTNQHQELTIKFDNLQNSLQIMIATNQQQLNSQINFFKSQQSSLSTNQLIPKTIEQVFSIFQDRFSLCLKISQQNKFLKEKINDIELKFEEIKQRYEEVQKQKGYNSMIPELMQSLEELKRERKKSNSLPENTIMIGETKQQVSKQSKELIDKQTMTIRSQNRQAMEQKQKSQRVQKECEQLKQEIELLKQAKQSLLEDIGQWSSKYQNIQNSLESMKIQKDKLLGENQSKIQSLQENIQRLQVSIEKERDECKQLRQCIDTLNKQIQSLREQNHSLKESIDRKSIELTLKQTQLGKLSLRLSQLQSQSIKSVPILQSTQTESERQKQPEDNNQNSQKQNEKEVIPSQSIILQQTTKRYEEKIKQLITLNENFLQNISDLKHQLISKNSQINRLTDSLQKSTLQLTKTKQSLAKSEYQLSKKQQLLQKSQQSLQKTQESLLESQRSLQQTKYSLKKAQQLAQQIQQKYKKQMAQNQEDMLNKIKFLQTKVSQNQKELIYLRNNKQSIQNDHKKGSKQKKMLEQAVKQLQAYKNDVQTRILPNIRSELQTLKKQHQRVCQQKQIIQQHNSQNMSSLNINNQQLLKQIESIKKQKIQLQTKINELTNENIAKKIQIDTFQQTINKLNKQTTQKLLVIEQLNAEIKKKSNEMEEIYEEFKSKQRKYQSQLNQQRIKAETMKRTISVQETKLQQNQKSSNKLYEQSMHKDKKISYMEIKLKEYKHLIQSLKKEKDQLQKTFLQKIKNYQDTIPQVVSEQELSTDRKRSEEKKQISKSDGALVEVHANDNDTDYLKNQILSYEESNMVLKEQNSNLRDKIRELQDQLQQKKKQVENLQQKRQQTLKQIQKLNIRSINGTLQPVSSQFNQKQKQFNKQKEQLEADKQKSQQRMKKIALKAYKGFDILLKKHQSLYKDFIDVFVKEMADRQQVKNIEGEINSLIKKSTDMKDVFQDYL